MKFYSDVSAGRPLLYMVQPYVDNSGVQEYVEYDLVPKTENKSTIRANFFSENGSYQEISNMAFNKALMAMKLSHWAYNLSIKDRMIMAF